MYNSFFKLFSSLFLPLTLNTLLYTTSPVSVFMVIFSVFRYTELIMPNCVTLILELTLYHGGLISEYETEGNIVPYSRIY